MKNFIFIFFVCFFSTLSFAAESLTQPNKECTCQASASDKYEEPQSFNFGKFKGQCVDSCRFRPAHLISSGPQNSKIIEVANILHFGGFYKSKINLDDIKNVEAGFEEFRPGIHHVFMRFNLKDSAKALKLIHQSDLQKEAVFVRSLVISPEGVPPVKHKYNLLEGFMADYLLVHRLVTGEEMERWTQTLKHVVKLYPLTTDAVSAAKIFNRGVSVSNQLQLQNVYQLITNNCSTSTLNIVDAVMGHKDSSFISKIQDALPLSGPIGTLRALSDRHLLGDSSL